MFFFQTMFQQVYNGITHSNTLNAVTTIAQGILLLCALFGVYEAYSRGGDARSADCTRHGPLCLSQDLLPGHPFLIMAQPGRA